MLYCSQSTLSRRIQSLQLIKVHRIPGEEEIQRKVTLWLPQGKWLLEIFELNLNLIRSQFCLTLFILRYSQHNSIADLDDVTDRNIISVVEQMISLNSPKEDEFRFQVTGKRMETGKLETFKSQLISDEDDGGGEKKKTLESDIVDDDEEE